jgi:uncharacterized protein DUF1883/TIR domain-containing protein
MAKVFDLGHQSRGETVEVTLRGSGANVMLVDSSNLSNCKAGRRVNYRGGLVTRSPYRIAIPSSGRWYVIVSMDGLRGNTNAAVRMLRGALPAARQAAMRSPLAPIRQAADDYTDVDGDQLPAPEEKPYDVFVCHASDDKEEIVRPLALALREQNLAVWYDEFELKIGDVLRRKIDEGLIRSRFGVVVLSPAFFAKGWRQYELDGLVTMEVSRDRQLILPIWHNVAQADVMGYSPSLASKLARSTADLTVEQIAAEIAEVARA